MKNLKTDSNRILLVGIGNTGRGDDGLGWKFADFFQDNADDFIDVEYRYQLQIEDAALISRYDTIIFVDASHEKLKDGFEIKPCKAAGHFFYSSHMQSPQTILFLADSLFATSPEAFTVAISGFDWKLKTSLHSKAEKNLQSAINYFKKEYLPAIHTHSTSELERRNYIQ